MKRASYSTAVKAIAMSVALAFSTMTFAAETKCTKVAKANSTKAAATSVAKKAPSFLFVIQAKQGKIETKDGKTFLVLKHADVNHVIMFSDRPNRIVKYITGTDLQKLWKEGKDSFAVDPPNAVLSSAGQKAQIVILNGMTVTETTVESPISISEDEKKEIGKLVEGAFKDVTAVVDSWGCDWGIICFNGCHYTEDDSCYYANTDVDEQ